MVLSGALALALQGGAVTTAAPPPTAPVIAGAGSVLRRPVWVPASFAVLHVGAIAFFVASKIVPDRCEGNTCFERYRTLRGGGELVPWLTAIGLGTGAGLLGRHDGLQERKVDLWRYRIAGAVLVGVGALLGGAAFSAVGSEELPNLELRVASKLLWTSGLPLLTYAFGYRHAALARLRGAAIVDGQRVGLVVSGRF